MEGRREEEMVGRVRGRGPYQEKRESGINMCWGW